MRPSAEPPIAAVTSVSDRRPKTARRVLEDVADKAGLSRNRAHLRFGLFSAINAARAPLGQMLTDWPSAAATRSRRCGATPVGHALASKQKIAHECIEMANCIQ